MSDDNRFFMTRGEQAWAAFLICAIAVVFGAGVYEVASWIGHTIYRTVRFAMGLLT